MVRGDASLSKINFWLCGSPVSAAQHARPYGQSNMPKTVKQEVLSLDVGYTDPG